MCSNNTLIAQMVCLSLVKQINRYPAGRFLPRHCLQTNNMQSVSELQREK